MIRLSDEQTLLRRTLRALLEEVAPLEVIRELDDKEEYPEQIVRRLVDLGLYGLTIGTEHGGSPADVTTRCVVLEELARAGSCLVFAYLPTALFCGETLDRFGTDRLKDELLPGIVSGSVRMAMALTEPNAGSDLSSVMTTARPDGDGYLVSGQKTFITGADRADYLLTLVRTGELDEGFRGLSALVVPTRHEGVEIRSIRKLAGQATHTCEVFLSEVPVPRHHLVGDLGKGSKVVLSMLDVDHVYTAAASLGMAQGAFDLARSYASERVQFGVPISRHQAVGHLLASTAIELRSARLLTYEAAWRLDQNMPARMVPAMAKVKASETATRCAENGMQILGGYSYTADYAMERYYRETKLNEIAGGTNQVLRTSIARLIESDFDAEWD